MEHGPALETVSTKFVAPPLPPSLLARPRLAEALNTAPRVTAVVAPAGFGKTVAVADWVARSDDPDRIGWLSLGPEDDEPLRFWLHLIHAFRATEPEALGNTQRRLDHGSASIGEQFTTGLINEMCLIPAPVTVILDNFEHISRPEILKWLTYLLEAMPSTVRFVLCSRAEPGLPFSKWHASGYLSEIRVEDLRFTDDEAGCYLDLLIAGEIGSQQLQILTEKADGWIAGLYLAALGVLRAPDVAVFVDGFGRRDGPVAGYLVSEVLEGLPRTMRSFLLETSILESLNPEICDALTDRRDSHLMLPALVKHGIFVNESGAGGIWTYHPLFKDVLRSILEREAGPTRVAELHGRAAAAYRDRGEFVEALSAAIEGRAYGLASEILEDEAMDLLRTAPSRLGRYLAVLSEIPSRTSIRTHAMRIWTATLLADIEELEHLQAEHTLRRRASLESLAGTSLAYLSGDLERLDGSLARSRRVLSPQTLAIGHGFIATARAKLETGVEHLINALQLDSANIYATVTAAALLSWNRVQAGKLNAAAVYAAHALEIAGKGRIRWFHGTRWAELALAHLEYDRGQLDDAFRRISEVVEAPDIDGLAYVESRILASRISHALGQPSAASQHLAEAVLPPTGPTTGNMSRRVALAQARICLLDLDIDLAEAWLPDWRTLAEKGPVDDKERLVLARFLIGTGRFGDARDLLLSKEPGAERSVRFLIEAQALHAIAASRDGDPSAPMLFEVALSMAEAEGFAQPFIEDSNFLAGIGRPNDAGMRAPVASVHRTLAHERISMMQVPNRSNGSLLVEPLTDREQAVARFLPTRLTNQEIAADLYVSVNTVKSHVKAIYRKLGVENRNDAVAELVRHRVT